MRINVEFGFFVFALSENEAVPLHHHEVPFADLILRH